LGDNLPEGGTPTLVIFGTQENNRLCGGGPIDSVLDLVKREHFFVILLFCEVVLRLTAKWHRLCSKRLLKPM
jgi:hypothetical protein